MVRYPIPRLPACENHHSRSGFALLITITLVAFLVLVLVALATLTRVETQVASNGQQLDQARQNALMALNIALGELQKYAGPDQRVTTTADITATTDKTGSATPDPVFAADSPRLGVQPGARYWTGVWGNNQTNILYQLRPNQIPSTSGTTNRRGVSPVLLNWLVSGNEAATYADKGSRGGAAPGTGYVYSPASTVNLSDLSAPTIAGNPAVLLVGANSVGSGANATQNYVAAPLVKITAPAGSTPGMGSTATPVIGGYAWWVGDEGVKARINLQNGYQSLSSSADKTAAEINSFITSQRSGVEFMDLEPAGTASPTPIGTDYDFTKTTLPNIVTGKQLPLLNTDTGAQTRLRTATQSRFHDITARSFGVLSDTYAGGLKKDLTADIADKSSDFSYRPKDDENIFTPISTSEKNLPTWGFIRNWARITPGNTGGTIIPSTPSDTNGGIYPTIAYFSLGFNYLLQGSKFKMAFYPIISLHNPYPFPIKAVDYDVGMRLSSQAEFTVQVDPDGDPIVDSGGLPILDSFGNNTYSYDDQMIVSMSKLTIGKIGDITSGADTFLRMRIHGVEIPPGQRMLFVLPDSRHNTEYSHSNPPVLERAPDTSLGLGESNYFVLTGQDLDLSAATANAHIRLKVINNYTASEGFKYTEVSLALAEDNALFSTTWNPIAPGIYQEMLGVYPSISHLINFGGAVGYSSGAGYYCATTALGDLVSAKQVPPSYANSAFRVATGYEGGGWWSSQWKMGFVHLYYPSRVIADGSLRAPHIMATSLENYDKRPDGNNRGIDQSVAAGIFGSRIADANADQGRDPHPGVAYYRYTTGVDGGPDTGSAPNYSILWDVLSTPDDLLSLGQLQHVPFSLFDFQPSYLFGNSYANKRIPRYLTYNTGKLRRLTEGPTTSPSQPLYDTSWLLNHAMWDKYFVSGVPSGWDTNDIKDQTTLPNARMTYYNYSYSAATAPSFLNKIHYQSGTNEAYDQAAANLLVSGAFNINSTSEQAWRAILSGTYKIPLNPEYANSGDAVETAIPYPRFTHNLAQGGDTVFPARPVTMKPYPALTGLSDGQFGTKLRNTMQLGNRGLYLNAENNSLPENTSAQAVVAELARSIVNEIRQRGPFLSLSDFVNRPLTSASSSVPSNPSTGGTPDPAKVAGIKGVLQAGIDNMNPAVAQVNPVKYQEKGTSGYKRGTAWPYYDWDSENAVGGPIIDTSSTYPAAEVYRSPFSMAPKMLTQADLLSTLGPVLSARSDTFTIRTYGEKRNPATLAVEGRAWCEAVVQRVPDYMGGEPAYTDPSSLSSTSSSKSFGRAFKVVSFRWLTPEDI